MPQLTQDQALSGKKLDSIGVPVTSVALPRAVPKYRLHKPSGRAVVTIGGKDDYLGIYGSKESKQVYQQRVAEWFASGCPRGLPDDPLSTLTVSDLVLAYWRHVKQAYSAQTRDGTIAPTLRRLRRLYSSVPVVEFGPLRLKAFRQSLIDERIPPKDGKEGPTRRLSRRYVNRSVHEARRMFRWGVGEELVSPTVLHGLEAVEGLRIGRTDAPETEPVRAVPDANIEATLPALPPVVADMVRVQRLTGMRPGELCSMTGSELDTSGDVWFFTPRKHKTAHHGKSRQVAIGPRAQEILRQYLKTDLSAPLFSPAESERERKALLRSSRKSPLTPSQRARDAKRAAKPRRKYREFYTTMSYALAISRACERTGVPHWSPNQLRHARATELRKTFGLDAAGAVLGHAKLETTQIYAEKNAELAARVAKATG